MARGPRTGPAAEVRADCARLAALDDREFGVRLLAATPTHEGRDPALLAHWARAAEEFGAGLATGDGAVGDGPPGDGVGPRVVERTGGLDPERLLLARYTSRPAAVELYTDSVAYAEELIDALGWRDWYPAGSVRAAALAHEAAHCRLHAKERKAALRRALGHTVLRLGPYRLAGHVAGADELAAHAYARATCGLGRSPLLLTAALSRALRPDGPRGGTRHRTDHRAPTVPGEG
ncbi:hypothetical protein [Streptomyces sp. Z26]|uniref:hypothetical protein n=1 Tax=Streptomyces sp. Z26 TaxID=2500177 RepID=UPI001F0BB291|nr:hypothetical protein [Streptomyces sp. Z26]